MTKLSEDQQKKARILREKLAEDFNENEAETFATTNTDKQWYEDFSILLQMIKDPNFTLSKKNKLMIMGTLAYVILPIDIIPDFIPIVGWLDDIFILALTTQSLKEEIDMYREKQA